MNKIFLRIFPIILIIPFTNCQNKDDIVEGEGSIYGYVTDYATGKPIHNANVQLRPTGETTLTGSDGMYEFYDIEDGNYSITVSKAEYTDLIDDYVIKVKNGCRMRRDLQIAKESVSLKITDMLESDLPVLDFGNSLSMMSFNIYNNGTVSINCQIEYNCKWITSVSEVPNSLKPGQNAMISIQIDRDELSAGENITFLYIRSNNGSNILTIRAIGESILPNVLTLPVTYSDGTITAWCNTFHGEVICVGNPAYHKRGFCYSTTNSTPTIDDKCIEVSGTGLGEYSCLCEELMSFSIPYKTRYYVRAWLMYDTDNKIQYGNVQSFVYNDY